MKKYFMVIVLVLFTLSAFSQDSEKQVAYYSKLRKQNQTAGRILLYGGAGLIAGAVVLNAITKGEYAWAEGVAYFGFPIGIISMVVSTTYFNRAARYKKKIASISLINQPLEFSGIENRVAGSSTQNGDVPIKNSRLLLKTIPAVSLRINF